MQRIESAALSKAVGYVTGYLNSEDKIQVIEPLTCMIRLAMLAFKPKGTKICIYENAIYIQEPSLLQGTIRWLSGDNRNDLHYLLAPITKALQKWVPQPDSPTNQAISHIYTQAIAGLERLKQSYSSTHCSSLTAHSIDLYINLITTVLQGDTPPSSEDSQDQRNTYMSFNRLWTDQQINLIYRLFQEAEQNTSERASYLEAIENILSTKVKCAKEILVKQMQTMA